MEKREGTNCLLGDSMTERKIPRLLIKKKQQKKHEEKPHSISSWLKHFPPGSVEWKTDEQDQGLVLIHAN